MKTNFLLPNKFKKFGWILLVPSIIFGILMFFFKFYDFKPLEFKVFAIANISFGDCYFCIIKDNISNEIIGILLLLSLIMIAFSKEKNEDEFIAKTRLDSLVWATYVNYAILLFCFLFFYGFGFMYVMIFNMFTILIFFIIRFYYIIYKSNKSEQYEK